MSRMRRLGLGAAFLSAASLAGSAAFADDAIQHLEVLTGGGAYLGVSVRDVHGKDVEALKLTDERGAIVAEVREGSPAEKAGIKPNDVIVAYEGERVQSVAQFVRMVRETPPGRKVDIEVRRGGAAQKLSATLEEQSGKLRAWAKDFELKMPDLPERPDHLFKFEGFAPGPRKLGIEFQEISGQLARYFQLKDDRGILVSSVDQDGPAGKAGMKAGDVILKMGSKDVRTSADLRREVVGVEPGEEVPVTVQRDGKVVDLRLKLANKPATAAAPRKRRSI